MAKTNWKTGINFKFRIPWNELCKDCRAILEQRKKEQFRVKNRFRMAKVRSKNNTKSLV